jgi:hypothetical protein
VPEVARRAGHHPRLGVATEDVRADERGLEEDSAGATERVEDAPPGPRPGQVGERAGLEGAHTPWLEEGPIRRPSVAVVPDRLRGEPAEGTGTAGIAGAEQRPEDVVRVVQIDGEAALDEGVAQGALGRLGVDARRAADVDRADGDGAGAGKRACLEETPGVVDGRVGGPNQGTGPVGERQGVKSLADPPGRSQPWRQALDGRGTAVGLAGREGVVLAGEFEHVHVAGCGRASV